MDLLLVLPLALSFFIAGLSDIIDSRCTGSCPAGYHVAGKCGNNTYRCQQCETNTFTAIPNQVPKCLRCSVCEKHAKQIKACVPDNDVVCACIDGFYSDKPDAAEDCKRCPCEEFTRNRLERKWIECLRCLNDTNCRKQCKLPPTTTSTFLSAHLTTNTSLHESTTAGNLGLHKEVNQVLWMILAAVLVSLLLLLSLLLFCLEKLKLSMRCPCWSESKDQELPRAELKSNESPHKCPISNEIKQNTLQNVLEKSYYRCSIGDEQFSHQNSSPCVMIYTSVETPIQSPGPANPGDPDSVAPLLPSTDQNSKESDPWLQLGDKDEQAKAWPAVVLYAIIREVPLRRWKEFLRLLSLSEQQMDRVELEAGLNSTERQYQLLRLWSQCSSASLDDVFCALHRMELSGCAQLLQESLEDMHWTPKVGLQVGATNVAGGNLH